MANKEKNFVSAIIYVHNAENRIGRFLKTVIDVLESNFEHSEVICVNDSSDDNSLAVIKEISEFATNTSVSVVNMSYFHGLELSMNAGMDMSIGDFVFEFDSTYLDFDPAVIMEIYEKSLKGYDIVSASADRRSKLSSRFFYKLFDRCSDLSYEMTTESFRVLSRRVINRISSMNKSVPYRKACYANCGLKTAIIKYKVMDDIRICKDKSENKFRLNLAIDAFVLFSDLGYRFAVLMSIIMIIFSVMVIIYSIFAFVLSSPVAGWTSTILFLSVAFFGLFMILAIIIKYLQILVNLVFKRKNYSFESIEKLTK